MELRHLKYFVAVAEELHFRRAAEKLNVAQPAISEQIRKLEAELGVQLLERSSRQVALTQAGAVLLREARTVLRDLDAATDAVRHARVAAGRRARVGYGPYGLPATVAPAFARLGSDTARMHFDFVVGDARATIADLRRGVLDAAIVTLPAPVAGLRVHDVGHQGAVAAVRTDARLPLGPLDLQALAPQRLMTLRRTCDPSFHDALVTAFRRRELWLELRQSRAGTIDGLLLEVGGGAGIALMPESATARSAPPGIEFRTIFDGAVTTRMAIVTRDEQPAHAVAALVDAVALRAPRSAAPPAALAAA